jgi:endonuclease/exonuclease/phosphatase family metal-dependent hydrolase
MISRPLILTCSILLWPALGASAPPTGGVRDWREMSALAAPEAVQAAAADGRYVYAVSSTQVAKYDRRTGERIALSAGPAKHLNSAFLHDGRVYCAHSNYPQKPEHSEIKVLDPQSMQLSTIHDFGASDGSLTWCVHDGKQWWCHFAGYGADNGRSYLARFDDKWHEEQRWTLPPEVIARLGRHSLSGGVLHGDEWLVTGHDDPVLFRLQVPNEGNVLTYLGEDRIPFTGQGFAIDGENGGLVGIRRDKRQVVFAAAPAPRLRILTYNIHHGEGGDGRLDLERIAGVIRSVAPDVVALQEVDRDVPRSERVDQAARLAELTGMTAVRGENIELDGGGYGNAVLTRWPVRSEQNHALPNVDRGEQRGVLDVDLAWPDGSGSVRFLATHFDHRPAEQERLASASKVNELVSTRPDQPAFLAGDLNAAPESNVLRRLAEQWTPANAEPLPTIPVEEPRRQIDFILLRPANRWRVVEVKVLDEAIASDHRALLAVFELNNSPRSSTDDAR